MKKILETDGGDSSSSSESISKRKKSEAASKRHAVQEQKRRQRINDHLNTLRQLLIPNMNAKTAVKASILTETVRQVRELRKRAAEVALRQDGDRCCGSSNGSRPFIFPGEGDEATVSHCEEGGSERRMVKATVCCEDRPGLNRELTEAIRSVGARAVRAEMATIGGRTKAELVVQWQEGVGEEEEVGSLRSALKAVVENRALGCSSLGRAMSVNTPPGLGHESLGRKRARVSSSIDNGWADRFLLRSV
uniref:BHLH domain-containing protein n=1 Tax=Davidia involucrata TaxID=16924 RepID=A0A5B7C5A2_DAVIN